MARLIAFAGLSAAPWKNGAGGSTEIAVFPPGAGWACFDWRLSVAAIAASGPFSVFAGFDRSLALLECAGAGLALTIDGAPHMVDPATPHVSFAGEAAVRAEVAGPSLDFNVMTRRQRYRHQLASVALPARVTTEGTVALFLAAGPAARLRRGQHSVSLARHDTLLLGEADAGCWECEGAPGARLLVVRIVAL
ncbi:MAG: HutD family protein [Pseudomonadota bacterium]